MIADGVSKVFNASQFLLHGSSCTLVIPGILLALACALLAYRQATQESHDIPMNGFLSSILLQMVPLVALKMKLWKLTDRVSLVPKVLVKSLLMHLCVETLRIASVILYPAWRMKTGLVVDVVMLVAIIGILRFVFDFPFTPGSFLEHADVRNLCLLAIAFSVGCEVFFMVLDPSFLNFSQLLDDRGLKAWKVFFLASNYVDILAFMPAVWRLYQAENEFDDRVMSTTISEQDKRTSQYFFLFVFAFYCWDDVMDPLLLNSGSEPIALAAHAAHFVLLLDFIGFFVFQVKNPDNANLDCKGGSEQMQGLLESNFDDED